MLADTIPDASPTERPLLRWIEARLYQETQQTNAAIEAWRELAASGHPLAPWAAARAAESLLSLPRPSSEEGEAARATFRRQGEEALTLAHRALETGGEAIAPRARWLRTRALLRNAPAEGLRLLRRMANQKDVWGSRAAAKLATRLQRGDIEERIEALRWWVRIARRDMDRAPGRALRAVRAAFELSGRLPRRALARHPGIRRVELERLLADALLSAGRSQRAARHYAASVRGLPKGGNRWCEGKLGEGRALYRARKRRAALPVLRQVTRRCRDAAIRATAWFLLGRSLAALERYEEAQHVYETLWRRHAGHRLADDARYRAAMAAREAGDRTGFVHHLERLVHAHRGGDMRPRALFLLAMAALDGGKPERALEHFETLGEPPGEADREGREGRSAYWRAVALLLAGDEEEAERRFATLARRFPLSYYGRLALQRLGALNRDEAERIEAAWQPRRPPGPLYFPEEALPADRATLHRALALLQVRETPAALAELRALGATGPRAEVTTRWLTVALLEAAGAHVQALRIARRMRWSFFHEAPRGDTWWRWRLAHPEALTETIEQAARAADIAPALLFAVVREESGFDPNAVSRVGARGLTQLMPATAHRMAARSQLPPPTPSQLLSDPALNLRLGATYLHWLQEHLGDARALVPAAYNAGERAVGRWLRSTRRRSRSERFDRFVEAIPYDETRRYTRRVLQSYGVYTALRGEPMPPFPERLPILPAPPPGDRSASRALERQQEVVP